MIPSQVVGSSSLAFLSQNQLGMLLVSSLRYVLDVCSASWTGARHLLISVISA